MTRKPFLKHADHLVPADFAVHPVWVSVHLMDYDEPWYDDTDETDFRPWTGKLPVSPEDGMYLVRATFTLADGRVLNGFLTPQIDSEPLNLGIIQPQVFLPSGTLTDFWDGMFKRDPNERTILYVELGKDPAAIFPIHFAAEKGLAKGHVCGSIPGFCWCPKEKVEVYH